MYSIFRVGDVQIDVDNNGDFEVIVNGADEATGRLGRIRVPLSRHQVETMIDYLMCFLDTICWEEEARQQALEVEPAPEGGPDQPVDGG